MAYTASIYWLRLLSLFICILFNTFLPFIPRSLAFLLATIYIRAAENHLPVWFYLIRHFAYYLSGIFYFFLFPLLVYSSHEIKLVSDAGDSPILIGRSVTLRCSVSSRFANQTNLSVIFLRNGTMKSENCKAYDVDQYEVTCEGDTPNSDSPTRNYLFHIKSISWMDRGKWTCLLSGSSSDTYLKVHGTFLLPWFTKSFQAEHQTNYLIIAQCYIFFSETSVSRRDAEMLANILVAQSISENHYRTFKSVTCHFNNRISQVIVVVFTETSSQCVTAAIAYSVFMVTHLCKLVQF